MRHFSIVCYLIGEQYKEVQNLQEKIMNVTGSRACLDFWEPHLTLGDGIELTNLDIRDVEESINNITQNQKKFDVEISGFGGLSNRQGGIGEITTPYVLWINVAVSNELQGLVNSIKESITKKYPLWYKMSKPYTPHITVAFRDLTKEGYEKGIQFLQTQSFLESVAISNIALVEKLADKDIEYKRFNFSG